MAGFDLTGFELSATRPLLPQKSRRVKRVDGRRLLNGGFLAAADRRRLGGYPGAVWPSYDLREPGRPVDAAGRPIPLRPTEGQAHGGRAAHDMSGSVRRGGMLPADRAYDSDSLRETLAARSPRRHPPHALSGECPGLRPGGLPQASSGRSVFQKNQMLPFGGGQA